MNVTINKNRGLRGKAKTRVKTENKDKDKDEGNGRGSAVQSQEKGRMAIWVRIDRHGWCGKRRLRSGTSSKESMNSQVVEGVEKVGLKGGECGRKVWRTRQPHLRW